MSDNWMKAAEEEVLAVLKSAPESVAPTELFEVVREMHRRGSVLEPARVKVAALNLVSKGQAKLDDEWRLVAAG